jgi:putative Holliday junction resolvase
MRILAVDPGEARTGLALSDPHAVTCRPLRVLHERDVSAVIAQVLSVAHDEGVDEVIVGVPRPLGGGRSEQMTWAEEFARRLAERAPCPVHTWDERFTSKLAERGRRKGAPPADSVAACHLLQSYLDARSLGDERDGRDGRER